MVKKLKKIFITIFLFIILVEIIIQLSFLAGINLLKLPILYYNPYCDQKYWSLSEDKNIKGSSIEKHKILSYVKKNLNVPKNFENRIYTNSNNKISFYGSSYINHEDFKKILQKSNYSYKNYSLDSYGLDQIFLSYKLTSSQHENGLIIIGFLLEDLDRSIFEKRDYAKTRFIKQKDNFILKEIPSEKSLSQTNKFDFFFYRFVLNFYNLIKNDFDPRQSTCKIEFKKKLFKYFINEIKLEAKRLNQQLIIVTFNLKDDLIKKPTWRYSFIRDELAKNSIPHIDSLDILKKTTTNLNNFDEYFGDDLHNNYKSFKLIFSELEKIIMQYK